MTASTLAERARTAAPFAELFERVIASMSEPLSVVDRIRRVVTARGAAAGLLAFDEEQLAVWRFSQTCQGVGVPTWVWELVPRASDSAAATEAAVREAAAPDTVIIDWQCREVQRDGARSRVR